MSVVKIRKKNKEGCDAYLNTARATGQIWPSPRPFRVMKGYSVSVDAQRHRRDNPAENIKLKRYAAGASTHFVLVVPPKTK